MKQWLATGAWQKTLVGAALPLALVVGVGVWLIASGRTTWGPVFGTLFVMAQWLLVVAIAPYFASWEPHPGGSLVKCLLLPVVLPLALIPCYLLSPQAAAIGPALVWGQLYLLSIGLVIWALGRTLRTAGLSDGAGQLAIVLLVGGVTLGLHLLPLAAPWLDSRPWMLSWLLHTSPEAVVAGSIFGIDLLHFNQVYLSIPAVADYPYAYLPTGRLLSQHLAVGLALVALWLMAVGLRRYLAR